MRRVLLISAAVLFIGSAVRGQEDKLGLTFDLTYTSKWMSKGAEGYGQQGGLFKTLDIDFFGSGFGAKVTHRNATGSGYVDKQRFDYRPYFKSRLFEGERYVTNYNISVGYEHYPGLARNVSNTTFEWVFAFSWPELFGGGLTPCYIAHYEYPAGRGYDYNHISGWVHRFGLGYDLNVEELPSPLNLCWEIAYTGGLGGADHDWSYTTFGIRTGLEIGENLTFVPGIYYQISMDDSVNTRNVAYTMLSMRYVF